MQVHPDFLSPHWTILCRKQALTCSCFQGLTGIKCSVLKVDKKHQCRVLLLSILCRNVRDKLNENCFFYKYMTMSLTWNQAIENGKLSEDLKQGQKKPRSIRLLQIPQRHRVYILCSYTIYCIWLIYAQCISYMLLPKFVGTWLSRWDTLWLGFRI